MSQRVRLGNEPSMHHKGHSSDETEKRTGTLVSSGISWNSMENLFAARPDLEISV